MSITEKTSVTDAPAPAAGPAAPSTWRRLRRPILVAATLAVVAGGTFAVVSGGDHHSAGSTPALPTTPVTMPAELVGLKPMAGKGDQYTSAAWQAKAMTASAGAPIAGHIYGSGGIGRSIRAVAARADLTKKLDLAWAADAGHAVGDAHCTQNVQLVPGGRIMVRPTVMVCWRQAGNLTAYIAMIDPRATLTDADGGKAIDELWAAVTKG